MRHKLIIGDFIRKIIKNRGKYEKFPKEHEEQKCIWCYGKLITNLQ